MKAKTESQKVEWGRMWTYARRNMPLKNANERGWTTLGLLLGYKRTDPKGRNMVSEHMGTNARRGSTPTLPQQQRLLRMFAGPYGSVIVRAVMLQRGIDPNKYRIWP
jgi:hypothetical protein